MCLTHASLAARLGRTPVEEKVFRKGIPLLKERIPTPIPNPSPPSWLGQGCPPCC